MREIQIRLLPHRRRRRSSNRQRLLRGRRPGRHLRQIRDGVRRPRRRVAGRGRARRAAGLGRRRGRRRALGGNRRREHRHPAALDVVLEIGLRAAERDVLARRRRPLVQLVALRGLALLRVLLADGNRRRPFDEQRGVARLRRRPRPFPLLRLAVRAPVVERHRPVVPRQGRAPFEPVRARGLPFPFRFNGPQRELPPCMYGRGVRVGRVVDVAGRRVLRVVVDQARVPG